MRTITRYSVIAIVASGHCIAGCSSSRTDTRAGSVSDGAQGPVVTVPVVIEETRADGTVHRESLGMHTYSERGLELVRTLRPVAFTFLESGELHSFTMEGADPVVAAAGGQIVAKSVMVDGEGRVVSWEPIDVQSPSDE
ncbi:hypothetical protein [Nodularia spumigena]|uniref:hypothetical protein n=1 Tax=Nodularia spumigena TaxID=70799 RepID=UPI002B1F8F3B|nr:hypothetical protein [Nodularia spumigena]MEA5557675.1 hypothetical protein [Nodularia spumigena CH309]